MYIYISEEHLGNEAQPEHAYRMVELLRDRGYDVHYGYSQPYGNSLDTINQKDWDDCLDIISREYFYQ